jgi:hypothetical protein
MLWSMGETEGLEVLIKMTEQKENLMRASGAWGIGEIATREKITEMRMASVDPESLMTNEFFERMDRALERMHVMLDETDLMILRNVVRTLGKMGNRRSTHHLIKKYQVTEDDEIKSMLLTTLDEIGSYSIVRQMKDDMN